MDKKTYEALKQLLAVWRKHMSTDIAIKNDKDYKQVETWIDEVAKEYEESFGQCDNQECQKVNDTKLSTVRMNKDFGGDTALWCNECIARDFEMLEEDE